MPRIDRSATPHMENCGLGHWRCPDCSLSVIYSRGSDGVEYSQLWQCCKCGFGMNSVWTDDGCSYCNANLGAIHFAAMDPSAIAFDNSTFDPFNSSLGFSTSSTESGASSAVACFPDNVRTMGHVVATDDLASAVDGNLTRFARFEKQFDHTIEFEDIDSMVNTGATQISHDGSIGGASLIPDAPPIQYLMRGPPPSQQAFDGTFPASEKDYDTSMISNAAVVCFGSKDHESQHVESGYGTMLNGLNEISEQCCAKKRKTTNTKLRSASSSMENDTSITGQNKRRRKSATNEPRLACPFFKRKPGWCTNKACTLPGYVSIARLKDHLRQAHLQSRCERCQATFKGKAGAKELESHSQQGCNVRQKEDFWGIDQRTLSSMRRGKGMKKEERWKDLYCELFQIDEANDVPSPCKYKVVSLQTPVQLKDG